jgi:predicted peptidase
MPLRKRLVGLVAVGVLLASAGTAYGAHHRPGDGTGIQRITPITEVGSYGQQVTAVAIEYRGPVNPRTLDTDTFTVFDTVYNFRFNPIEDLPTLAERAITAVYTNSAPTIRPDQRSATGQYVIVELDPADNLGWTVIVSKCPTFLCTVKVNPELPTTVVQNQDVHGQPGRGKGNGPVIGKRAPGHQHPVTEPPVNLLVDEFTYGSFLSGGMVVPYHYYLPAGYQPGTEYPLMVVLPGHGMGWDGDNTGVQLAADIPATAWLTSQWTGRDQDVIVLAPQHQRVGADAEAELLVKLVDDFLTNHSVDPDRVYATTVSYGSTLLWGAFAQRPDLWAGGLVTGGFQVDAEQATTIAAAEIPIWITHGINDHLLNISLARNSHTALLDAHTANGKSEAEIAALLQYTEYDNDAFSLPDYHAAFGPTYEDTEILRWLLDQRRPTATP